MLPVKAFWMVVWGIACSESYHLACRRTPRCVGIGDSQVGWHIKMLEKWKITDLLNLGEMA